MIVDHSFIKPEMPKEYQLFDENLLGAIITAFFLGIYFI
jgi:hypothetical protein